MTERAQPGAIDSLVMNDELGQALGQLTGGFDDGWIVPAAEPTRAAQRRDNIDVSGLNAFEISTSASSLDVTVDGGEAFTAGWCAIDTQTTVTLPTNSTTTIVVGWDVDAYYNSSVDSTRNDADSVLVDTASALDADTPRAVLYEVTTDGSGVTDVVDSRQIGPAVDLDSGSVSSAPEDSTDIVRQQDVSEFITESGVVSAASGSLSVEDLITSGDSFTVPVAQSDGTIEMDFLTNSNQPLPQVLYSLQNAIAETRFDVGLQKLDYFDGFYDILLDETMVSTKTNTTGFSGSAVVSSGSSYGSFTSTIQTVDGVPTSLVVGNTFSGSPEETAVDGESFVYPDLGQDISSGKLELTGVLVEQDDSYDVNDVSNGDTINVNNSGNDFPNPTDVTLIGGPKVKEVTGVDGRIIEFDKGTGEFILEERGTIKKISSISATSPDWSTNFEHDEYAASEPAGIIVGYTDDGNLEAINWYDGTSAWSVNPEFQGFGSLVAVDDDSSLGTAVYHADTYEGEIRSASDGSLYSYYSDAEIRPTGYFIADATGEQLYTGNNILNWEFNEIGTFVASPPSGMIETDGELDESNRVFYLATDQPAIHSYDLSADSMLWSNTSFSTTPESIAYSNTNNEVYYARNNPNGSDRLLGALDMNDGSILWESAFNDFSNYSLTSGSGRLYGAFDYEYAEAGFPPKDIDIDVDGDGTNEISVSGYLADTQNYTIDLGETDESWSVSVGLNSFDVDIVIDKDSVTRDPEIQIDSPDGSQTISYSGLLEAGTTVDLSADVDTTLIGGGDITVTANILNGEEVEVDYTYGTNSKGDIIYVIEDGNANAITLNPDSEVSVSFESSDLTIQPFLQNGFGTAELFDYALYTNN